VFLALTYKEVMRYKNSTLRQSEAFTSKIIQIPKKKKVTQDSEIKIKKSHYRSGQALEDQEG